MSDCRHACQLTLYWTQDLAAEWQRLGAISAASHALAQQETWWPMVDAAPAPAPTPTVQSSPATPSDDARSPLAASGDGIFQFGSSRGGRGNVGDGEDWSSPVTPGEYEARSPPTEWSPSWEQHWSSEYWLEPNVPKLTETKVTATKVTTTKVTETTVTETKVTKTKVTETTTTVPASATRVRPSTRRARRGGRRK
jgi:hypothetical protein